MRKGKGRGREKKRRGKGKGRRRDGRKGRKEDMGNSDGGNCATAPRGIDATLCSSQQHCFATLCY